MTRPSTPAGVLSTVLNPHVPFFPLVQMDFDVADGGTQRLAGTDFNIDYGGFTWTATRGWASMEPLTETADTVAGIKFTLSGVPTAALTESLTVQYQSRAVTVLWACLDGGTLYVDPLAWKGRMDVPEIVRDRATRSISITAEHPMADWGRPHVFLFNHADQQRIDAGDNFFLGIEAMNEKEIVVFSKEVMMQ